MDCISIIPENTEIRCSRLQCSETSYSLIGVGISLRVGVFGYAPDTLDSGIFRHQFLYQIHIRSFGCHGHIDHFDSEMLRDSKMSVISGYGTQELYMIQLAPGGIAQKSVSHSPGYSIIHDVQAGIAADDHIFRLHFQNVSNQFLCLRNTVQATIISNIHSILSLHSALRIYNIEIIHCHIQLVNCRFSSGHIQFQAFAFCIFICSVQLCLQC